MLNVLDLFSGIGGFSLGLERTGGFATQAFCEIDPFARAVLAKHWPYVPIFGDVRELHGSHVGPIDVICGGYPCQPFSLAGKRAGEEDDRHLWPEYRRLIEDIRPAWVLGENVIGHISMGLDGVLSDLESLGYSCRAFAIPACAVDARHRRERVWIVAHAESGGRNGAPIEEAREHQGEWSESSRGRGGSLSHADDESESRRAFHAIARSGLQELESGNRWWCPEPGMDRVAYGVPNRVDRLKALGNAVVPEIPYRLGLAILEAEGIR